MCIKTVGNAGVTGGWTTTVAVTLTVVLHYDATACDFMRENHVKIWMATFVFDACFDVVIIQCSDLRRHLFNGGGP